MNKELYLENLIKEINNQGYGNYYSAKCTRYASRLLDNNLPVIFDTKHLSLLIGIIPSYLTKMVFSEERFYTQTKIPKKSGGYRELDIPSVELKYIQRWILNNILYNIKTSNYAVGFCTNKSILDNAKIHLNQHCVVNLDIKDFFPSISFEKVFRIFAYYGYTNEVSFILAKLCTFKGRLPQGSPASPCLSNIACLKLDARLNALAAKYESVYSRYADDLTFSSKNDIKSIVNAVSEIIKDENYTINDKKTRIAYPHQRQEVTGLIVNGNQVRVSKKYKRNLYQELYYCSKFGVHNHMQRIGCNKAFYKEHMYGKIYFVNMVEPNEANKLFALANQIQWDY
jgi:retron-type reverse transcriptase